MTNTDLLLDIIDKSGLKLSFIANYLGISRYTLSKKIHNKSEFLPSEINALCTLLKIEKMKDKINIFLSECSQKGNN